MPKARATPQKGGGLLRYFALKSTPPAPSTPLRAAEPAAPSPGDAAGASTPARASPPAPPAAREPKASTPKTKAKAKEEEEEAAPRSVLGKRRSAAKQERRAALDRLARDRAKASTGTPASASKGKPRRKRLRKAVESDGEDEWQPDAASSSDDDVDDGEEEDFVVSEIEEEEDDDDDEEEEEVKPRKRKPKAAARPSPKRARSGVDSFAAQVAAAASPSPSSSSSAPSSSSSSSVTDLSQMSAWSHGGDSAGAPSQGDERFRASFTGGRGPEQGPPPTGASSMDRKVQEWLRPDKLTDAERRPVGHPQHDPTTLYVPPAVLAKLTPGQRQYWDIKSKNRDVVLFFKMGKFYELFDDDADVGNKELGLLYMKGDRRHVGFPEPAFAKYAQQLVALGYKVGRVEQLETPDMLKKHNATCARSQKRKVVRRDMCSMLTKGTLVDGALIGHDQSSYLLALTEGRAADEDAADAACGTAATAFGVCFVDTSTGAFFLGEFGDNRQRSRLRTLLAQLRPEEVVYPRDGLDTATQAVLTAELRGNVLRNPIRAGDQFCGAPEAAHRLSAFLGAMDGGAEPWPAALLWASERQPLAMSAVGGCLHYLGRVLLDSEMVTQRRFGLYRPADLSPRELARATPGDDAGAVPVWGAGRGSDFLVLDGQTLENLEVLENAEGGLQGTLYQHLNHTCSPFGARTMKEWLAQPLASAAAINQRLDAVEDFAGRPELLEDVRRRLRALPDLERLLSRIHANGLARDRDAVMYTNVSSRKIKDFCKLVAGFRLALGLAAAFDGARDGLKSLRLGAVTAVGRGFPDLEERVAFFEGAFDHAAAQRTGTITPQRGVDPAYDANVARLAEIRQELDEFLAVVRRRLGDSSIRYVHKGSEPYQIEIKLATLKRREVPDEFEQKSSTKTVRRYWTSRVKTLAEELGRVEEARDEALRGVMRGMFVRFCEHLAEWNRAVRAVAEIDCLQSLAFVSTTWHGSASCRPEFVETGRPFLEVRESVHPALAGGAQDGATFTSSSTDFIPNDIVLGAAENDARFVLVSGPNMGGKSTLLRQACVLVIMAQMGCHVPAASCRLTPMDRVFTRVGANDRIMQGQSTFLVELEETANILRHATPRSLVILDELGRGTSTFDGTAIAYAVIEFLTREAGCLSLFSTHYHMLMEEFASDPLIAMYHMACRVNSGEEDVTFLYKFVRGVCPKSYGMNVGRLAGLPAAVVERARAMSQLFERRLRSAHTVAGPARPASAAADALYGEVVAAVRAAASGDAAALARLAALAAEASSAVAAATLGH